MGKRGPAPKPTSLRILQGDQPCRINKNEPQPAAGEVIKPELSDEAGAIWDSLADDLERKGVLSPWDVHAFATYCDAAAQHWQAREEMGNNGGQVTTNDKGTLIKSPWFTVWKDTAEVMQRYGARFGLTPSDRSQLSLKKDDEDGTKERLLS